MIALASGVARVDAQDRRQALLRDEIRRILRFVHTYTRQSAHRRTHDTPVNLITPSNILSGGGRRAEAVTVPYPTAPVRR